MATLMEYTKQFRKVFDSFCYRRGWDEAFRDFVELAACAVHQEPYFYGLIDRDDDYARIEQSYLSVIKKFDEKEVACIVELYSLAVSALRQHKVDFIGQIYMDLEVHNKHNGEFFTPTIVAQMMAKLQMDGIAELLERQGHITLQEPACGAGVMVIEAANVMREEKLDPSYTLLFQAIDINRTCFNMAYFQLSVLGLAGEVVHGDSLRMEYWERRPTPQWKRLESRLSVGTLPDFSPPVFDKTLQMEMQL